MLYRERVTLQIKNAYGNPLIKTPDADAQFTSIGSQVQIDLDLNNNDLHLRRFKIEFVNTILHKFGAYRCEVRSSTSRPHHSPPETGIADYLLILFFALQIWLMKRAPGGSRISTGLGIPPHSKQKKL